MTERHSILSDLTKERVLVLDGSMGVMIQRLSLSEDDFRGSRFADHPQALRGNNDILCLSRPEAVADIHRQYLEAGADIIETNTFNSTTLSQREYGTESLVRELNLAGARIARTEADRYSTPSRPRFVAGSIGPTGFAASLPTDINDPAARAVSFADLSDAFEEQAGALIDGGVDILLIETVFDSLNAKAAIAGVRRALEQRNVDIPLIVSITISDVSGRLLSGHTPRLFCLPWPTPDLSPWASTARRGRPRSRHLSDAWLPYRLSPRYSIPMPACPTRSGNMLRLPKNSLPRYARSCATA